MTITIDNNIRIQTSDENKSLTDGTNYSKKVFLGKEAIEWNEILDSDIKEINISDGDT